MRTKIPVYLCLILSSPFFFFLILPCLSNHSEMFSCKYICRSLRSYSSDEPDSTCTVKQKRNISVVAYSNSAQGFNVQVMLP